MIEKLFGSVTAEKVLFFLNINNEGHATQIARNLKIPLNMVQKQLQKFEEASLIVSTLKGKTRIFAINPRYPFFKEFQVFLNKAYDYLPEKDKEIYMIRKRPRRTGKPL